MLNSIITQVALVLVAAISAIGSVYSVIASRAQREADARRSDSESEDLGDQTLIRRLAALSDDLQRLQKLSDERFERLVEIETLITEHVGWDFQVVRKMREHQIDIEDPPSLVYVRKKLQEAKDKELEQQHNTGPQARAQ